MKKILIIAGPNGAGKPTFAEEFLPNGASCAESVNPDLIAAGSSAFQLDRVAFAAGRQRSARPAPWMIRISPARRPRCNVPPRRRLPRRKPQGWCRSSLHQMSRRPDRNGSRPLENPCEQDRLMTAQRQKVAEASCLSSVADQMRDASATPLAVAKRAFGQDPRPITEDPNMASIE